MSGEPLVSIVVPTWNRAELLPAALDSVMAQDWTDWELVLVDDGSTDDSARVLRGYAERDERIRVVFREHEGHNRSRNHGIGLARGQFLALFDSDDRYVEGGLGALVTAMTSSSDAVKVVYGDFDIDDENAGTVQTVNATPPLPRPLLYFQFLLSGGNPILPSAAMVDREAVVEVGGFDESIETVGDLDLWTRIVQHHDIAKVDRRIAIWRRHGEQLTAMLALRRVNRDRVALAFFERLGAERLFPEAVRARDMARELEGLAREMLKREHPSLDTAVHILREAQARKSGDARARLLREVEQSIEPYLQETYGTVTRIV